MDLYAQFKNSLKDPLSFQSAYIFFVFFFVVFLSGILLLLIFGQLGFQFNSYTACNKTLVKNFNGNLSSSQDKSYQFNYSGNNSCFLNSFVTWENPNKAVSLWVYSPLGNVQVINPLGGQTHANFYQSSPLAPGVWRIVLRTDSTSTVGYSVHLSIN